MTPCSRRPPTDRPERGALYVAIVSLLTALCVRRAKHWPSSPGRITKSEVAASHLQSEHQATRIVNLPAIEYEYSVDGQKYSGRRIGIGEDSAGPNIEATLARYPLGADRGGDDHDAAVPGGPKRRDDAVEMTGEPVGDIRYARETGQSSRATSAGRDAWSIAFKNAILGIGRIKVNRDEGAPGLCSGDAIRSADAKLAVG